MNKTEPKQKESYEPPEVRDIAPVSIVAKGDSDGPGDETYEDPNNW